MLKERGYYPITLSDNTVIPVRFGTWTLDRFCELSGDITLRQMGYLLSAEGGTLKSFILLILCAAECVAVDKGEEFKYTKVDACNWIDDMGGMVGEKFLEMLNVLENVSQGDESKKKMKTA